MQVCRFSQRVHPLITADVEVYIQHQLVLLYFSGCFLTTGATAADRTAADRVIS